MPDRRVGRAASLLGMKLLKASAAAEQASSNAKPMLRAQNSLHMPSSLA